MSNIINQGKKVIRTELEGLKKLYKSVDKNFERAIFKLSNVKGKVVITGVGKSLNIASKISSTMTSTGTPSQCVDPTSMAHGDLGILRKNDALIIISNSGNSSELKEIVKYAKSQSILIIGISSNPKSILLSSSDIKLVLPKSKEACAIGMAPTTSTTMALVIGDAICVALMKLKKFKVSDYKKIHPGGSLGASMLQIKDIMYKGKKMPIVLENAKMQDIILEMSKKSFGHVGVKNKNGILVGIISDGDLRRSFKKDFLKLNANKVMTKKPIMICQEKFITDALSIMNKNKITCLFIFDKNNNGKACGIIHLHQILQYVN
mgnify:CR=1 FL=1